jgi:hypothetical protein
MNKPIKYQHMKENATQFVSSLFKSNLHKSNQGLRKTGQGMIRSKEQ